jgi:fructose-specific phosphotransferase system IIA component
MALMDILSEEIVKIPLTSTNKPDVLRELVQVLKDAGKIDSFDKVLAAIHEREKLQSTGLEKGIAVPHGKTDAVKKLVVAVGISKAGIEFNALDQQPSKLFFMLVAPPNQPGPHVEALAEIARLSRSPAFCNAIIAAQSPQEVIRLLTEE